MSMTCLRWLVAHAPIPPVQTPYSVGQICLAASPWATMMLRPLGSAPVIWYHAHQLSVDRVGRFVLQYGCQATASNSPLLVPPFWSYMLCRNVVARLVPLPMINPPTMTVAVGSADFMAVYAFCNRVVYALTSGFGSQNLQ